MVSELDLLRATLPGSLFLCRHVLHWGLFAKGVPGWLSRRYHCLRCFDGHEFDTHIGHLLVGGIHGHVSRKMRLDGDVLSLLFRTSMGHVVCCNIAGKVENGIEV